MFLLATSALATSRTFETPATDKLNIVVDGGLSSVEGVAGKEVAVCINLLNNQKLSSLKLTLEYSEKLSVVTSKRSSGEEVPKVTFDIVDPEDSSVLRSSQLDAGTRTLKLNWVSGESYVEGDCKYATIIFKVAENAKDGDFLPITITKINPNDVFDENQKNISYNIINGGVDVVEYIKGDVDGDGALSNRDVMMLSRHLNGSTPNGFVVNAADFNGDSKVDGTDLADLFAAINGYTYAVPDTDNDPDEVPENKLGLVVDGGESTRRGLVGRNVDVKISLKNNPGISSLKSVVYWSDSLTLVDAKYDIYDENDKTAVINTVDDWSKVKDSFAFNWVSGSKEVTEDTAFVTLTFKVPEDAKDGEFMYVAVTADNIFNASGNEVKFVIISGGVNALDVELGDASGDGAIDNKDVVTLFRYVSGSVTDDDVVPEATDFDGDGETNNKDVVALFRFVSSSRS